MPIVRRLSDTDDIAFSTGLGGVDGLAYGTIAILFRPAVDPVLRWIVTLHDLVGASLGAIGVLGGDPLLLWQGGGIWGTEGPAVTIDDWHLLVARKDTGDVRPRWSLKNLATGIWVHEDGTETQLDWTPPTGGSVRTLDAASGYGASSDFAAAAIWANSLPWAADAGGDAAIEAAGLDEHLDNWRDAEPSSGWEFSQPDALLFVEDFTLNRADETTAGVGTPTTATDLDFIYAAGSILALSRNYLRSTQTEPGATGIIRDLSETQGTPTTVGSGNISTGGFTEVLRFWRVVDAAVDAGVAIDTSISMAAVSASTLQYRWIVHRYNSADVLQESSTPSTAHNTAGVKTQTMALAGPFVAGDKLALSLELGKAGGGGSRNFTLNINHADSWVEFSVAEATPDVVTPADADHGHTADAPALTQVHALAPADAAHGHTADQPVVSSVHTLTPDTTSHGHAAGSPALAQAHELTPAAAGHTQVTDQPALTQTHEITAADAAHGHTADQAVAVEQGTGLAREFTSAEFVTWAIGTGGLATLLQGAFTVAAICRRVGTPADQGAVLDLAAGLDGSRGFFRYTDADQMDYLRGQFQSPGAGPSWTAADGWVLVAWTKAAGTAAVRYHKGVLAVGADSWTHVDSAGTVDNDDQACDRAQTRFMEEDGWVFRGRYGVMAAWGSVLSDGALEALTSDYADWQSSAPVALWRFDQAATTTAVDDQTGNGADQTALAGSAVVTDDPIPGFTFGEAATAVTPADSSHGHTADQPAITQTHELVPADAGHGHTADQPVLAQAHQLTPASAAHGHAVGQPTVDQAHALTPDSGAHGQGVGAAALTQVHQVVAADAAHAQTTAQPVLTGGLTLIADDAAHGHTASQPAVSQLHTLTAGDAAHGQAADAPALTQIHELAPTDSGHSHTADQPTLASGSALIVAGTSHGHTAGSPTLGQQHTITVAAAIHAQVAEQVALTQLHLIAAADATHAHTADRVEFTGRGWGVAAGAPASGPSVRALASTGPTAAGVPQTVGGSG